VDLSDTKQARQVGGSPKLADLPNSFRQPKIVLIIVKLSYKVSNNMSDNR